MAYDIELSPETLQHLRHLPRKHLSLVKKTLRDQLAHDPILRTRNKKPLQHATWLGEGVWEIRFGPENRYRAFYTVQPDLHLVSVLALGRKEGNRLFFGDQEVDLSP